jgi:alanyl-tRNA synthetase
MIRTAAHLLRTTPTELVDRVSSLLDERKRLERELSETKRKLAMSGAAPSGEPSQIEHVNGTKFFRLAVAGLANNELKSLAAEAKTKVGSGVVAIANTTPDGKAGLVVGVTDDLTSRFNAIDLVKKGALAVGGKGGGGFPDLAQAGGPDGTKTAAALDAIAQALGGA